MHERDNDSDDSSVTAEEYDVFVADTGIGMEENEEEDEDDDDR